MLQNQPKYDAVFEMTRWACRDKTIVGAQYVEEYNGQKVFGAAVAELPVEQLPTPMRFAGIRQPGNSALATCVAFAP